MPGGASRPGGVRTGVHGEAFERVHVCLTIAGVSARVTRDRRNQANDGDDDDDEILLNEMRGKEKNT